MYRKAGGNVNYNAMIVAYGKHGRVQEAIAFFAAVGRKKCGLVLALKLWHMTKQHNIQPDIRTYNVLLWCIRNTNFDDLKPNKMFEQEDDSVELKFMDTSKPNFLAQPPVVTAVSKVKFINSRSLEEREKRKPLDM